MLEVVTRTYKDATGNDATAIKILVSRGDTGSITVTFTGNDTPPDGTVAKVSLQKIIDSPEVLWEKLLTVNSGRTTIPFLTRDTDYPRGKYFWCLRLAYANGDVYTPMEKPQEFEILPASGGASGGDDSG